MDGKMNMDIRPCMYLSGGKYRPGLFHHWVTLQQDHIWLKKGALVALIEYANGRMDYVEPDYICFTDTKEQMGRFGMHVESEGKYERTF